MPSWAGTFTLSCLVPSGTSRECFAKSPGGKKPHDSLKAKTEANSHDTWRMKENCREGEGGEIHSPYGLFLLLTLGNRSLLGQQTVPLACSLHLWPHGDHAYV